ncbi:hypothetical protein J1605_005635 [Eschrichtius robustus]|uniref:Uncharacterized protein n=1 Tax=Eschrichtius robustus TaxID=9764 RepID=A0AB34H967_ESCRO|nr:hypothetical protein J1605_005635 [Eschrichtius robustus]
MRGLTAFTLQQELLQEDPIQGVLSQLIIPLAPIQDPGQGEAGEPSAAGSAMNEHWPWAHRRHETTNASSSEVREEKLLYASSHNPKAEPGS